MLASDLIPSTSPTSNEEKITNSLKSFAIYGLFDYQDIAERVCHLLAHREEREFLGKAARQLALEKYDLKTICLPQQLQWLADLGIL